MNRDYTIKPSTNNKIVFYSKRNRVTLGEIEIHHQTIDAVAKEYSDETAAEREFETLYMLNKRHVRVPIPYAVIRNTLYIQYLPGVLLTEIIDNLTLYPPGWIPELACWFYQLHRATQRENGLVLLKEDNNLRNFIYYQNSFYGLDFEQCVYGLPQQDIGQCCAFILSNYPDFTVEKFTVTGELIHYYCNYNRSVNESMIQVEIDQALEVIAERRKK